MCTAVVGGSIHRAATRVRAQSDQRNTTPPTSHRTKDRRKLFPSGVSVCVFGIAVTFQNDSRVPDISLLRFEPKSLEGRAYPSPGCPIHDSPIVVSGIP